MEGRWGIVAGILATSLLGAALLGGEDRARPGSGGGSAASRARARLLDRVERERTDLLRPLAIAREEAEARWSASDVAVVEEFPICNWTPNAPFRPKPVVGGGTGSSPGVGVDEVPVPVFIPDDGGNPEPEDEPPPPPSPEAWLVRHQAEDGSWDGATLSGRCTDDGCTGPGEAGHAVGDTGLALLAFLGTGETHRTPRYGKTVRSGLKHLKSIQDLEGCFGERIAEGWLEDHAIAALAMAETYGLTQSPLFKATAQNGVDFLQSCRDPYLAWRYGVIPGPRDAATTTWAVMALKSARGGDLEVEPESFEGARLWVEQRLDPGNGRLWTGGTEPGTSEATTAMGVLVRYFCGAVEGDPLLEAGARTLLAGLAESTAVEEEPDPLLDYVGSLTFLALSRFPRFRRGEDAFGKWRNTKGPVIQSRFRAEVAGCAAGSVESAAGLGRFRTTVLERLAFGAVYTCGYQRVDEAGD